MVIIRNDQWLSFLSFEAVSALSITNVCTGGYFGCALLDDDGVKCWGHSAGWGQDEYRDVGDSLNELGDNLPYVNVSSTIAPQTLFCGFEHLCIVFINGDMKCMGKNDYGKLGLGINTNLVGFASGHEGDLLPFVDVGAGLKVLDVSLSASFSCIIVTGGYVKCFGEAAYGDLGYENNNDIGTSSSEMGDSLPFVNLGTNVTISSIRNSVNGQHTCAILSTPTASAQKIKCWGNNEYYQLGYHDTRSRGNSLGDMGDNLPLVDLGAESRVTKLSLSKYHTCALLIDQVSLKCWGIGENGRLGSGSTDVIILSGDLTPAIAIDSGYKIKHFNGRLNHACIVYDDDLTLKCFGDNSSGQLGQEDTVDRGGSPTTTIPYIPAVQLGTGSLKISSILTGGYFNCILFSDSSLKCFGTNYFGQCAIGTGVNIGDSGGEMGSNLQYAQLFESSPTSPTTNTPTKHPTIQQYATKTITSFSTGVKSACAVFIDGKMKCWGLSRSLGMRYNLVGDSLNEVGEYLPYINVGTNETISKVSSGGDHVCVVLLSGDLKCMGSNEYGQIGLGSTLNYIGDLEGLVGDNLPNVDLGTLASVLDVATGKYQTCVLITGNKVKCYGNNYYGQLGQGNTNDIGRSSSDTGDNLLFVDLGTDVEVASVHSSAFSHHNCVILSKPTPSSQRVKCWGYGGNYQLGYGDNNSIGDDFDEMGDNLTLVDLGIESKVSQLSLGESFTCALLITNEMKCFGYGYEGQLALGSTNGISSTGDSIPFVPIDSEKTIKYVGTGSTHTCIVYDDELTLKCTGSNTYGQLGQGDTMQRGDSPTTTFPNIPAIDLGTGSLKIKSVYGGEAFTCVLFTDSSVKCFGFNEDGECLNGRAGRIGDSSNEMGGNLQFAMLFSPTTSPTTSPTLSPSKSPSLPTKKPTRSPTKAPTLPTRSPTSVPTSTPTTTNPSKSPTTNPTKVPTNLPTKKPTTAPSPPTRLPTNTPSTTTPTSSPTVINNAGLGIGLGIAIPLTMAAAGIFAYRYRSRMRSANNSLLKNGSTDVVVQKQ